MKRYKRANNELQNIAKSIFVPLCTKINKKVRKHDLDFEGKLQIKTMIQFNGGENCKIAMGCINKRNNDYIHFCISVRDHLARHIRFFKTLFCKTFLFFSS
jgi:hypothetical protein